MSDLALLALVIGVVALARSRIRSLPMTAPMLFVGAGMVLSPDATALFDMRLDDETVALAAELTLALVLFSDAARIDTASACRSLGLPARLLGIGLPLSIGLGTLVTALLLTDLSWSEAALVAAILAPTDAALGEAVITNPLVPVRIRQALNVESGLNDGLVVPIVAVFAALAAGTELESAQSLAGEALVEILIALVVGVATAAVMTKVLPVVIAHGWTDAEGLRLAALGVGLGAFAASVAMGGNGFLAAFACGLAARYLMGEMVTEHTELAEDLGQIGAAATFVIFGALMVWPALDATTPLVVLCAIGTLTIGRLVPVAISMIGSGLKRPTVAFLGWFGPRGLASMLFGLLVVAENDVDDPDALFSVITVVIVLSVLLHGVSASPGATRYGRWFSEHEAGPMSEAEMVPETRVRWNRTAS